MTFRTLLATVLLACGLAGCFTSDTTLFSDAEAVAPFARITFGAPDAREPNVMTREGKTYIQKTKDGTLRLRFKAVEGDTYLAEMSADKDGKTQRLYGLVVLDRANNTASTYKSVSRSSDTGPGLRPCGDQTTVCIDDIAAYLAVGKAAIAAKGKPDTAYKVKLE